MLNDASNCLTRKRSSRMMSIVRACLCLSIVISGLALRRFGLGLGLPAFVVKYGGSALWATMAFFLVAMAAPARPRWRVALMAASIAVGVELFRLVHVPWLDAFRLTTAGALLLGRIFSLWNMLAYGVGIVLGVLIDRLASVDFPRSATPSCWRALKWRRTTAAAPRAVAESEARPPGSRSRR
jgi:hypothetical protein